MGASRRSFLVLAGAATAGAGAMAAPASAVSRDVPLLSTYVAGSDRYRAPDAMASLAPGDLLSLRREPGNAYDPRAVRICLPDGQMLGYVPRIHNEALAKLLDAGIVAEARVTRIAGGSHRPDIGIAVSLPAPGSPVA
jgi:HIRAN domain